MIFNALPLRETRGRVIGYTVVDAEYEQHALCAAWLHDLHVGRDLAMNTVTKYAADFASFLTWLSSTTYTLETAPAHLSDYMYYLGNTPVPDGRRGAGRPREAQRINDMLIPVRNFYSWACSLDHVPARIVNQLYEVVAGPAHDTSSWAGDRPKLRARHRRREVKKVVPETIPDEHFLTLVAGCRLLRDRFILVLLRYTGLRIGQALGLRIEDLHLAEDNRPLGCPVAGAHIHRVRRDNPNEATSKSRVTDYVPVPPIITQMYGLYLPLRDATPNARCHDMVFVNADGDPLSTNYVNKLLERRCRQAGLPHYHPHLLRHTYATAMRQDHDVEMDLLQRLLGHLQPESTQIYNHVTDSNMRAAVDGIAPIGIGAPR